MKKYTIALIAAVLVTQADAINTQSRIKDKLQNQAKGVSWFDTTNFIQGVR